VSAHSSTLGKYQIIREIARSNDIVYEAYDPEMNRRVALKELFMPQGVSERQKTERLERFKREARAAGSLAHPNIVVIYDFGEENGRYYIAMEYLEGQTLRNRLDAEGALPQEEACKILCEVLDALAYAHERGVIHRDIKPENIQLLPDGRIKLTDFGIARLTFEPSLTADGQVFGTPSYMSPEQIIGRDIDEHSDIFSCGIVLYEAISGKKPFIGDNVVAISHSIMHVDPPDPVNASYPIIQIIKKALDKSPTERFASAKQMKRAIEEALLALKSDPYLAQTPPSLFQTSQPYNYPQPNPYGPGPYYSQHPAPYDPYSQQGWGTPYGHPYGQPGRTSGQTYRQHYPPGTQQYPLPFPPLSPGWTIPSRRKPLLSPEAADFLKKTLLVVFFGGVLLALAVIGVMALNIAAERHQNLRWDEANIARSLEEAIAIANRDYDEAIERLLRLKESSRSDKFRNIIRGALSEIYIRKGETLSSRGETIRAQESFESAVRENPENPFGHLHLARSYKDMAAMSRILSERISLYENSRKAYEDALQKIVEHEKELQTEWIAEMKRLGFSSFSQFAQEIRREAADAMILLALEYLSYGSNMEAEIELHRAMGIAPPHSSEYSRAEEMLKKIENE